MEHVTATSEGSLKALMERYERQLIESALSASAGNQRRAAAALGLLPTTLHAKMKRLGLLRRSSPARVPDAVSLEDAVSAS
jgi:DNA-binding NtrC family response regulator